MRITSCIDQVYKGGELECNIITGCTAAYVKFCCSRPCAQCICFGFITAYRSDNVITGGTYIVLEWEEDI